MALRMDEQQFADMVTGKFRSFLSTLTNTERKFLADAFEDAFEQAVTPAKNGLGKYWCHDVDFEEAFAYLERQGE